MLGNQRKLVEVVVGHGVIQFPLTAGTTMMLLRAAFGVLANLTVNEMINRGKEGYGYLRRPNGSYSNPFDRGPLTNLSMFYGGHADWESLAEQQALVGPPS